MSHFAFSLTYVTCNSFAISYFIPGELLPHFIVGLERVLPYNALQCHTARSLTHL